MINLIFIPILLHEMQVYLSFCVPCRFDKETDKQILDVILDRKRYDSRMRPSSECFYFYLLTLHNYYLLHTYLLHIQCYRVLHTDCFFYLLTLHNYYLLHTIYYIAIYYILTQLGLFWSGSIFLQKVFL